MTSLYDKYKNKHVSTLNSEFHLACRKGQLENVRYLLTSPELNVHANINVQGDYGLILACDTGHLDIVKYLLTSPELSKHSDIHGQSDFPLIQACSQGHLEVVKYLLTSPDLEEHADMQAQSDAPFIWACQSDQWNVVRFLIFDMNIPRSTHIDDNIHKYPQAEEWLIKRELRDQLEIDLGVSGEQSKKLKI